MLAEACRHRSQAGTPGSGRRAAGAVPSKRWPGPPSRHFFIARSTRFLDGSTVMCIESSNRPATHADWGKGSRETVRYDSAVLERVAQRFRRDMWESVVPEAVTESGVEVAEVRPGAGDRLRRPARGPHAATRSRGGRAGRDRGRLPRRGGRMDAGARSRLPGAGRRRQARCGRGRGLARRSAATSAARAGSSWSATRSPPGFRRRPRHHDLRAGRGRSRRRRAEHDRRRGAGAAGDGGDPVLLAAAAERLALLHGGARPERCGRRDRLDADRTTASPSSARARPWSTLVGSGCNTALLRRRLLDAAEAGCHTVFVELGDCEPRLLSAACRNLPGPASRRPTKAATGSARRCTRPSVPRRAFSG